MGNSRVSTILKFRREFLGILNVSQNCHFLDLILQHYLTLDFFQLSFE